MPTSRESILVSGKRWSGREGEVMANALYWSMEATKFAQLLSEKELALNTSQVEAMQLRHRIAELEAELKEAHLLQDRTDQFLNSALLELKKALVAKPATKLQSIAKEALAGKEK